MPSFIRNTSGGKAVSGGALAPRSRRGNTNQAASYWAGGAGDILEIYYLVVGGGGGGAGSANWQTSSRSGGGGGGGYKTSFGTVNGGGEPIGVPLLGLNGTTVTVTVGGGGAGGAGNAGHTLTHHGSTGASSVMGSITSTGGERGLVNTSGSKAGSFGYQVNSSLAAHWGQGGSSGAGSAGGNASSLGTHGTAGIGLNSSITGTSVGRGGAGGAGAAYNTNGGRLSSPETSGGFGGGAGGLQPNSGSAGSANTGGGGGSGVFYPYSYQTAGGSGGSGFVAIRYLNSFGLLPSIGGGLTYSTNVDGDFRVYQFTAGTGSIVFPS